MGWGGGVGLVDLEFLGSYWISYFQILIIFSPKAFSDSIPCLNPPSFPIDYYLLKIQHHTSYPLNMGEKHDYFVDSSQHAYKGK